MALNGFILTVKIKGGAVGDRSIVRSKLDNESAVARVGPYAEGDPDVLPDLADMGGDLGEKGTVDAQRRGGNANGEGHCSSQKLR